MPPAFRHKLRFLALTFSLGLLFCAQATSQSPLRRPGATGTPSPEPTSALPQDPLGRSTPRGTVLGFLIAARKGDNQIAAQYLDTHSNPDDAAILAAQLFTVLDHGLPPRLNEISDRPEGTASDLLNPNLYVVGTITGTDFVIMLQRVERGNAGPIWLFSSETLKAIPSAYEETHQVSIQHAVPAILVEIHLAGIPLYEWLLVIVGVSLTYFATVLMNRLLVALMRWILRLGRRDDRAFTVALPQPIRFLILGEFIRWLLSRYGLSLIARQLLSTMAIVITIVSSVWLLMLLSGRVERYVRDRLQNRSLTGAASMQRLIRRLSDVGIVVTGALIMLHHFGINPTAALAGLGVGGIAIALAAQKTLENVVGGMSLIFDEAVRIGDFLKVGDVIGTVDDIGVRSIRIRTLDRTMVIIPNGQLANMNLELISSRDKFWFHPAITLRHETTEAQMARVVEGVRNLLGNREDIDNHSLRVRFFQIGTFSLNIDVFAYIFATDSEQFLRVQDELLRQVVAIVKDAGAEFAFPSQTMYLAKDARATERTPSTSEISNEIMQAVSASP
jgi:MscS family membrane protein